LVKSLYECKGYNARQFITKFPDHQQTAGEFQNFNFWTSIWKIFALSE